MRVAVIGGAGFIGSHLVDSLVQESHEVLVIDNLSSGKKENINSEATFIEGDIRKDLSADLQNTDTVFHLAADPDVRFSSKTPEKTFDINVRGTFMLLESCRKADVSRFLFFLFLNCLWRCQNPNSRNCTLQSNKPLWG